MGKITNIPIFGFLRIAGNFWPDIRRHRLLIIGSLAAFFLEACMHLLEPWPLKFIFDRIITVKHTAHTSGIPAVDALAPVPLLILAGIAGVVFTGIRAFASYLNTVGFAIVGNRVMTSVRNKLYNHIQCLPLSFHTKARSGDLLIRIISDVSLLQEVAVTAVLPLMAHTVILIGMVLVMFWLHWQLAMIALVVIPVFWWLIMRSSRRIQEVAGQQRRIQGSMAATAAEAVSAIKTVQALSLEDTFSKSFSVNSDKIFLQEVKAKRLTAGLERSVDFLVAIATAVAILYGGYLVIHTMLTPGDLLVFITYFRNAFRPLSDFAKYSSRLSKASVSGERILDLLNLTPQIRDLPDAVSAGAFKGEVQFNNVDFSYEEGKPVLEGINCVVRPGEHVLLSAPSGAGKTTFVNLIMRFYEPNRGQVLIDGKDIRTYTIESLRSQVSIVLQDTLLFAATVAENIAYGTVNATLEEVKAAARLSNAHDFIMDMPQGYNTIVGERGVTLSQGQRQRIAIARAVIRKSPILILDEPSVNLDKKNEEEVNSALERLAQGKTTFLISHDLQWLSKVDRIFYIEEGHLKEDSFEPLPKKSQRGREIFSDSLSGTKRVYVSDRFEVSRDKQMPFMGIAIGPVRFQEHLNRSLQQAADPELSQASVWLRAIRVRRYKPGRRCLIEYDVALKSSQEIITLIGKTRASGLDLVTYKLQLALWNKGFSFDNRDGIFIPRPVGTIPELNMWLYRRAPGVPVTQLLSSRPGFNLGQRIALAAHKVHTCGVSPSRSHTISDELAILRERLALVRNMNPQWTKRLSVVLETCEKLAANTPAPAATGIYRDFYADNILVDDSRLYLVDLDLYCLGDPALDIGNFIGHLKELGLRLHNNTDAFTNLEHELKEEFLRLSGKERLPNIEAYTTLTLVRHIYLSTQFIERRAVTEKILELSEKRLEILP